MSDINPENPQNYPNLKDMEGIILASEFTKENLKRERGSLLQKLNDVLSWYPDLQEFVSEKVRQDFTPILERKDFLIKEIARLEYLLQLNTDTFSQEDFDKAEGIAEEVLEEKNNEVFASVGKQDKTEEENENIKNKLKELRPITNLISKILHPDRKSKETDENGILKVDPDGSLIREFNNLFSLAKTGDDEALKNLKSLCNQVSMCKNNQIEVNQEKALLVLQRFLKIGNYDHKSEITSLKLEILFLKKILEMLEQFKDKTNTYQNLLDIMNSHLQSLQEKVDDLNFELLNRMSSVDEVEIELEIKEDNKEISLSNLAGNKKNINLEELKKRFDSVLDKNENYTSEITTQEVPKTWEEFKIRYDQFLEKYEILERLGKEEYKPIKKTQNTSKDEEVFVGKSIAREFVEKSIQINDITFTEVVALGDNKINFRKNDTKVFVNLKTNYLFENFKKMSKELWGWGELNFEPNIMVFSSNNLQEIKDLETAYLTLKKFFNDSGLEF